MKFKTFCTTYFYTNEEEAMRAAEHLKSNGNVYQVIVREDTSVYADEYKWGVAVYTHLSEEDYDTAKFAAEQYAFLIKGERMFGTDFARRINEHYDSERAKVCAASVEKYVKEISTDTDGNAHVTYNL